MSLSCRPSSLSCLSHITLFSLCLQYGNNGIYLQIHCLPNVAFSFSVSFHDLSPSRLVLFLQCLLPAVPHSCHVSRTLLSFWYALQYCNNGIYLQIHCLPNVASSFSNSFHDCLPSAVFCSCGVSFLPSLFPVMSLAHHFLFGMLNSTATMASPFKFNAYLM
jgi:hypothetical protein